MPVKQNRTCNKLLQNDIEQVIARYSGFKKRVSAQGHAVLEGVFPITDPEGKTIDTVELRLIYRDSFPFAYPIVCETGGRFSRGHGSLHVNGDGTLCLNSPQQERIDCYTGLSTLDFMAAILVPNLAWRICVLEDIPFDKQEYKHYFKGILESYELLLSLKGAAKVATFIQGFVSKTLPGRNDPCFCGAAKKYKACHGLLEGTLVKIGEPILRQHLPELKRV